MAKLLVKRKDLRNFETVFFKETNLYLFSDRNKESGNLKSLQNNKHIKLYGMVD